MQSELTDSNLKKFEWDYSRNRRMHWLDNGEVYGSDFHFMAEIKNCTPMWGKHHREHGYDLYLKGVRIGHAETVHELKEQAERSLRGEK